MAVILGSNSYGKAECRLVRVDRAGARHTLTDLNVTTALSGDLDKTHLTGDNSDVLPTDTQKNTVYALARKHGVDGVEPFALLLARHFVDAPGPIHQARVHVEQFGWHRLGDHSFARAGDEVRTATVTSVQGRDWVVGGVSGLTLLNSTDSEFWGFPRDEYTTLPETRDRVLATVVNARWRFGAAGTGDWDGAYTRIRQALVDAFTQTYSYSLQQTLYAIGERILTQAPEVVEVRLALPNKHHFLVDLAPFGLDNPGEIYLAADRPYGLIEGAVLREDAEPAGPAWGG